MKSEEKQTKSLPLSDLTAAEIVAMKDQMVTDGLIQPILEAQAKSLGIPLRILEPISEERRKMLEGLRMREPDYPNLRAAGRKLMEDMERMILGTLRSNDEKNLKG
jgi:hypothetical protein